MNQLDLAVVMPVYNEEACIADVVQSWLAVLEAEALQFTLIVLNDGSKDGTQHVLARFASDSRVEIVTKPNSGHGPTILAGYARAVTRATWVFQVDSDGELAASEFSLVWRKAPDCDAVFGIRTGRRQSATRWLLTRVSRAICRVLFGSAVTDVNVPFRLMRASILASFLDRIPQDTFAPNVIIAGVFARGGFHIANVPVTHQDRRTGSVSIVRLKLWKAAFRSAIQTFRCRRLIAMPAAGVLKSR